MQNRYDRVKDLGAEIMTVSNDAVEALRRYKEKTATTFPMLSDEKSEAILRYDIKNGWDLIHRGVPHPATYIIDRAGVVRFAEVRQNFLRRTKMSTIFEELEKLK